jgi:hypothetical protein
MRALAIWKEVLVLQVAGEIDLATVARFRERLHEHVPRVHQMVILTSPKCPSSARVGSVCSSKSSITPEPQGPHYGWSTIFVPSGAGDTTPTAAARDSHRSCVGLAGVDGRDEIVAGHARTARDLLLGRASP